MIFGEDQPFRVIRLGGDLQQGLTHPFEVGGQFANVADRRRNVKRLTGVVTVLPRKHSVQQVSSAPARSRVKMRFAPAATHAQTFPMI